VDQGSDPSGRIDAKVSEFFGVSVYIYFRDHPPPHFHARYGGAEAIVAIETGLVLEGRLPPRVLGLLTEWASLHREAPFRAWRRARQHRPAGTIDPLR
jgi:hypothetical protein